MTDVNSSLSTFMSYNFFPSAQMHQCKVGICTFVYALCAITYLPMYVMFCLFTQVWDRLLSGQPTTGSVTTSRSHLAEFVSLSTNVIVRTTTQQPQRDWQREDWLGRCSSDAAVGVTFLYDSLWIENHSRKVKTSYVHEKLLEQSPTETVYRDQRGTEAKWSILTQKSNWKYLNLGHIKLCKYGIKERVFNYTSNKSCVKGQQMGCRHQERKRLGLYQKYSPKQDENFKAQTGIGIISGIVLPGGCIRRNGKAWQVDQMEIYTTCWLWSEFVYSRN